MSESMIERVAKALAGADNGAPTTWRLYEDDARVAIEAMRKPTEAMLDAGKCARQHWQRMIDSALSEREKGNG